MDEFLKSLNPKENEKDILIYGKKYKLWREGEYLGTAIWTQDANVGDSFQKKRYEPKIDQYIIEVYVADSWELIINH
ncbi:hypothetical protein [Chryseobacterium rhizosphaerae]|uniref:hypothetical protein n=1 Tax=Chryseobacterium rhizosphaerae TaxID=395937 RepID=UPI003D0C5856